MQLIHAILALLLVILGLLVWLMLIPEPALATGAPHSLFPAMNAGGDGLARLQGATLPIGWLGACCFLMMLLLTALGVQPARRSGGFWLLMLLVTVATQWVWWAMYGSYLRYLETGELTLLLGYPTATAWMLFGVWLAGTGLCLIYVIGFRRFIFTAEDEAAYEALRAQAEVPRAEVPTAPVKSRGQH